jgi:uncharacterized protein
VTSQLTHPGVYIREIPSGIRAITGVATSITAFVGRARRGPVNEAATITSYAAFERTFGGLWLDSALGYSVRDFYRLGGSTAIIVRVHTTAANDTARLTLGTGARRLTLDAASPGAWGSGLTATIDKSVANPTDSTSFNLTVTDTGTGAEEQHLNLTYAANGSRRVDTILAQRSKLVRVTGDLPTQPQSTDTVTATATGGLDGGALTAAQLTTGAGLRAAKQGLYALEDADLVNLIVIPPYLDPGGGQPITAGSIDAQVLTDTIAYAEEDSRRAFVIVDPPAAWVDVATAVTGATAGFALSRNAAVYFPRLRQADPLRENQLITCAPSGAIAGVIARTDAQRGVWKAPAGLDASLSGVSDLEVPMTDQEIGRLNPEGVNCLRSAPGAGHVVWGARTRHGADRRASEWKYVPVRRTALFLQESLYRGMQWVVFEPNDEPLWSQIRLNVGAFMNGLFRQGAFAGTTPDEAYFVKCDAETTTPDDVNLGIVNVVVGFAPLRPAEFVVISLQQIAGQTGGA